MEDKTLQENMTLKEWWAFKARMALKSRKLKEKGNGHYKNTVRLASLQGDWDNAN